MHTISLTLGNTLVQYTVDMHGSTSQPVRVEPHMWVTQVGVIFMRKYEYLSELT